MILNGQNALCRRKDTSFGALHCTNLDEDRPILSTTKMYRPMSFWKYKVYGDMRGGSSCMAGASNNGVDDDGIFGDSSG